MTDTAPFLVAGGGIGGLTAALALARAGFLVRVFEQAPSLNEIGAGLQLSPNATRILENLDVMPQLDSFLGKPESLHIYSGGTGRLLARMPLGSAAEKRWGAPYAVAHRSDLQNVLFEACRQQANIDLQLGCKTETYNADGLVTLCYRHDGVQKSVEGKALIGADGVHSHMRAQFLKDGSAPYSGYAAYRALIPGETLPPQLSENKCGLWLSDKAHIVHYPLRGSALINIVAVLEEEENTGLEVDSAEFYRGVSPLCDPLQEILRAPEEWTRWPIYAREPFQAAWPKGLVTLLGDAAHPMLPFLAQGAAQAIEDAACLAACIAGSPTDIGAAFQSYRRQRATRVARIMRESERNAKIFHLRGLPAAARDLVLRSFGQERLMHRYDWLYGGS